MASIMPLVRVNDKTPLQLMLEYADNPESLSEYSKVATVRPVTLVEQVIQRLPEDERNDLMQAHLSLYAGWYLQASLLSLKVDGVQVRELLNPLSTEPTIRNTLRISTEAAKYQDEDKDLVLNEGLSMADLTMEDAKANENISRASNLMVGKIIDVPMTLPSADDKKPGKDFTMPVAVTLAPRVANIDFMLDLFKYINKDQSWVERYHQWRSGEIDSLMDYIFALDINREERRLMLHDEDGMFAQAKARKAKGMFTSLLSGRKSINTASAITIISKESAVRLEATLDGGSLRKPRTRKSFFEATNSMILSIVNMERRLVTVYTRGYDDGVTYTFRDIKNMGSSPSAGLDMSNVLSQMSKGSLPGIR